jgi:hypothetical protein
MGLLAPINHWKVARQASTLTNFAVVRSPERRQHAHRTSQTDLESIALMGRTGVRRLSHRHPHHSGRDEGGVRVLLPVDRDVASGMAIRLRLPRARVAAEYRLAASHTSALPWRDGREACADRA